MEKYALNSHKKIWWKCPYCKHEFKRVIADVSKRGFICPNCGDGISYPNKFVKEVLNQLNLEFEREVQFDWSDGKRYDFFIPPNTIIEVHGEQHYKDSWSFEVKCEDVQKNDLHKKEIAMLNGIKDYIEIDARKSSDVWLKKNVVQELGNRYDLNKVDWVSVTNNSTKNILDKCLELWNKSKSVQEIATELNLSVNCVRDKLKFLTDNELCDYDRMKVLRDTQKKLSQKNKKQVVCITTGKEFKSINDAGEYYGISPKSISNALHDWSLHAGKFENKKLEWKFKEDYYNEFQTK